MSNSQSLREKMVKEQIIDRGITNPRLIQSLRKIPRENFVPEAHRHLAYEDTPIPLAAGQFFHPASVIAFMIDALELNENEKILEIGCGNGYATAILMELGAKVFAVESNCDFEKASRENLQHAGYVKLKMLLNEEKTGWEQYAPYDAILLAAGSPVIPRSLDAQLKIGGRMVMPKDSTQPGPELVRLTRVSETEFHREDLFNPQD